MEPEVWAARDWITRRTRPTTCGGSHGRTHANPDKYQGYIAVV